MGWFVVLLGVTAFVRGMGAGIIYDAALVSPSVRKSIGAVPYAQYVRANFKGLGAKSYVVVAWSGLLLTLGATIASFLRAGSAAVSWWTTASLAATAVAFLGTGVALPMLFRLTRTPDDPQQLTPLLERYARWYGMSAWWQMLAFATAVGALVVD